LAQYFRAAVQPKNANPTAVIDYRRAEGGR
jgi:hypothetical protein